MDDSTVNFIILVVIGFFIIVGATKDNTADNTNNKSNPKRKTSNFIFRDDQSHADYDDYDDCG